MTGVALALALTYWVRSLLAGDSGAAVGTEDECRDQVLVALDAAAGAAYVLEGDHAHHLFQRGDARRHLVQRILSMNFMPKLRARERIWSSREPEAIAS